MKGTKEFNQKVFELFYLYRRRMTLLQEGFARALPFGEVNPKPISRGAKPVSLKSINGEIRVRERVFFHGFDSEGTYPDHPFVKLCQKLSLNRTEQKMLICLLGQGLANSMIRNSPGVPLGIREETDLIGLVFPDPGLAFSKTNLFSSESRLVKTGLLEIRPFYRNKLPGEIVLQAETMQWLLGFLAEEPDIIQNPDSARKDQLELLEIENPLFGLEKVVLPENLSTQIEQAMYFYQSPDARNLLPTNSGSHNGTAILALFYGPPGTGKTYTASAIAGQLKKHLAKVQYASLRNMWYGNTEKNIVAAFRSASAKKMVLLFDEADALITARQMGRGTSTDNIEHTIRNLFLQEIERFNGVVILTTNMAECLDPALERRLNLKLEFPVPEVDEREKLWRKFLKKAPCSEDVNFQELAEFLPIAGGHIKNIVFNALRQLAYLRKDHPDALITQSLLLASARKESQFLDFKDKNKITGFGRH